MFGAFLRKDVRAYTVTFTVLCDALSIYVSFVISWWLRFKLGIIPLADTPHLHHYLVVVTLWAAVLVLVFQALGLYNIRMPLPFLTEAARVTQGMFISLGILFAINFFFRSSLTFSRLTVFFMTGLALIWLLFLRNILRNTWGQFLRKRNMLRRVLLIGWGDRNAEIVRHIQDDVNSGRQVLGVLSDSGPKDLPEGIQFYGKTSDLEQVLDRNEIDEVILGTLQVPHTQISQWILACERRLVQFRLVPDLFEILATRVQVDFISGVPLLGIGDFPLDRPFNRFLKRCLDIVGAIVGLILTSPLMLLGALWVRRESAGPFIYVQDRCGRDGRVFRMFKLRTMKTDAEKETGPVWTAENDTRRTRAGKFLRMTNIDETPQFWNVLRGQMSLVGPRPERPFFVDQFKDEIRHYMPRHSVKPGMTGWAQVNGLRGNTPLEERVRYDIFYFENWSIWFDLRIMIATILSFKNAY